MSSNNPALEQAYVSSLINKLKHKFSLTDYEADFLLAINTELRRAMPSTKLGLEQRINLLDEYRVKLLNMIYQISDKHSEISFQYKEPYNLRFAKLIKAGRPSTQAVESEILNDPAMFELYKLLEEYENFKSLLFGYLKALGECKSSCFNKVV